MVLEDTGIRFVIDPTAAGRGARQVNRALRSVSGQAGKTEDRIRRLSRAFINFRSIMAGVVVTLGARGMARVLAGFDQNMQTVSAITKNTAEEMDKLKDSVRGLAKETSFTATETSDALVILARAGLDSAESLSLLPKAMDLAIAGNIQFEDAATRTIATIKQYGFEMEDAERVTDVFAEASVAVRTTVTELAQAMTKAGTVAEVANLDFEETIAVLALLQERGIEATAAGTSLRRILSALINPTGEAGEALKGIVGDLDLVNPQLNSMADIFERFGTSGRDVKKIFEIFKIRGAPGFAALAQIPDTLRELTSRLKTAQGAARAMANEIEKSLGREAKKLLSALTDLVLEMGEAGGVMEALKQIIRDLSELFKSEAIRGFARDLGKILSGIIGGLSTLLTQFTAGLGVIERVFQSMLRGLIEIGNVLVKTLNFVIDQVNKVVRVLNSLPTILAKIPEIPSVPNIPQIEDPFLAVARREEERRERAREENIRRRRVASERARAQDRQEQEQALRDLDRQLGLGPSGGKAAQGNRARFLIQERQQIEETQSAFASLGENAVQSLGSIGDAISLLAVEGTISFKRLADALIADLIRVAFQALVVESILSAFRGVLGGLAPSTGKIPTRTITTPGGGFLAAPPGPLGTPVDITDFPRLQQGGIAMSPMLAQVGEVPEAIIPLDKLQGGGTTINQTFIISATDAKSFDDRFIDSLSRNKRLVAQSTTHELRQDFRLRGTLG